jgi:hypothetical protein
LSEHQLRVILLAAHSTDQLLVCPMHLVPFEF